MFLRSGKVVVNMASRGETHRASVDRQLGPPNVRQLRLDPVVSKIESRLRTVPEFYPKDNLNTLIYEIDQIYEQIELRRRRSNFR